MPTSMCPVKTTPPRITRRGQDRHWSSTRAANRIIEIPGTPIMESTIHAAQEPAASEPPAAQTTNRMAERATSPAMLESTITYSERQASADVHVSPAASKHSLVEHTVEDDGAMPATQHESSQQQPRSGPEVAPTNTVPPGSSLYPPG